MMARPSARAVLVTGASGGIGRAIARRFATEGDSVCIGYFVNRQAAEETAHHVQHAGGKVVPLQADLKDPVGVARMFDQVEAEVGRLDVVVHAAAAGVFRPTLELAIRHWDWTLNTVARSFLLLAHGAVPFMASGGSLIAISSLGAHRPLAHYGALGAAKAALEALVRQLAVECAPRGITVNAVAPGAVDTRFWQIVPEGNQRLEEARQLTPAGRLVSADDIAEAVFFLASPGARMIQGHTLVVDGGASLPLR